MALVLSGILAASGIISGWSPSVPTSSGTTQSALQLKIDYGSWSASAHGINLYSTVRKGLVLFIR